MVEISWDHSEEGGFKNVRRSGHIEAKSEGRKQNMTYLTRQTEKMQTLPRATKCRKMSKTIFANVLKRYGKEEMKNKILST